MNITPKLMNIVLIGFIALHLSVAGVSFHQLNTANKSTPLKNNYSTSNNQWLQEGFDAIENNEDISLDSLTNIYKELQKSSQSMEESIKELPHALSAMNETDQTLFKKILTDYSQHYFAPQMPELLSQIEPEAPIETIPVPYQKNL